MYSVNTNRLVGPLRSQLSLFSPRLLLQMWHTQNATIAAPFQALPPIAVFDKGQFRSIVTALQCKRQAFTQLSFAIAPLQSSTLHTLPCSIASCHKLCPGAPAQNNAEIQNARHCGNEFISEIRSYKIK